MRSWSSFVALPICSVRWSSTKATLPWTSLVRGLSRCQARAGYACAYRLEYMNGRERFFLIVSNRHTGESSVEDLGRIAPAPWRRIGSGVSARLPTPQTSRWFLWARTRWTPSGGPIRVTLARRATTGPNSGPQANSRASKRMESGANDPRLLAAPGGILGDAMKTVNQAAALGFARAITSNDRDAGLAVCHPEIEFQSYARHRVAAARWLWRDRRVLRRHRRRLGGVEGRRGAGRGGRRRPRRDRHDDARAREGKAASRSRIERRTSGPAGTAGCSETSSTASRKEALRALGL